MADLPSCLGAYCYAAIADLPRSSNGCLRLAVGRRLGALIRSTEDLPECVGKQRSALGNRRILL
jgi:hypothetical protein